MKVNDQITDTFIAYDGNWNRIGGLTYQTFVWVNGASSNTLVSVTEDANTAGAYYLQFTPTATGEWYIHLFNLSAAFDAYYFVELGVATEVWTSSATGNLTSSSVSVDTTAIANAVWVNSGTAVLNTISSDNTAIIASLSSVTATNLSQIGGAVWTNSGTGILNSITTDSSAVIRALSSVTAANLDQVWTSSGTGVLNTISSNDSAILSALSSVTASNLIQIGTAVWVSSGTAVLNSVTTDNSARIISALSSVTAANSAQIASAVWVDSGTSVLNTISSDNSAIINALSSVTAANTLQIANAIWANSGSSVLIGISVSAQNVSQIANAVWTSSGTGVLSNINITGVTAGACAYVDNIAVAKAVWGYPTTGTSVSAGSFGQAVTATYQVQTGRWLMAGNQLTLFDADGVTPIKTFNLYDTGGNPSLTGVVHRIPV